MHVRKFMKLKSKSNTYNIFYENKKLFEIYFVIV